MNATHASRWAGLAMCLAAAVLVSACGSRDGAQVLERAQDLWPGGAEPLLKLDLASAAGGAQLPFTVGQPLRRGDVPQGAALVADIPDFQFVVKNRWPDGSAKFAILSGRTDLAAGAYRSIGLRVAAAPAAAAAIGIEELKATGISASVGFSPFGTAGWSAGDWDTPAQTVVSGPQMSAWVYRKPIGSDAHLVAWLEVRAYKGGRVEVLPWIENGYLNVPGPTQKIGVATFTLGGTARFAQQLELLNHQRAVLAGDATLTHWLDGSDPQVVPRHDTGYFMATRLVPNYRSIPASSTVLASQPVLYTPLGRASLPVGMGAVGFDASIGLLPGWDALYLASGGDARAWRSMMINGLATGRYGIHYRDETTQRPLAFSSYPTLVMGEGSGVGGIGSATHGERTPQSTGVSPPTYVISHHPSMGYMAYLASGWNYFMEESQFVATANYLVQPDYTDRYPKYLLETATGSNTTRGAAWSLRTLAQAATITPDDDPLRGELVKALDANIAYYHGRYVAQTSNPLGLVQPYSDYEAGDPWTAQIWMDDFFTGTFGHLRELGSHGAAVQPKLDAFLQWKYRSIVGRLGGSGADQYPYTHAAQYTLNYAPKATTDWTGGTGPWYGSWGEVARAMNLPASADAGSALVSGYPGSASSYWGFLMPALVYAVDHGAAGAAEAWQRVTSASNYAQQVSDCPSQPLWCVKPRTAPVSDSGWVTLATDGQSFTLPVMQRVRFGADTRWVEKLMPAGGAIACNATAFGLDPAPDAAKQCQQPSNAVTSPILTGHWVKVADAGYTLVAKAPQTLRFGSEAGWVEKPVAAGSYLCAAAAFGGTDPAPGTAKRCEALQSLSSGAPQVPALAPASMALGSLQPGQWMELPNTKIRSVLPATPQPGYADGIVTAWSGGTVDTRRSRLLVWGGGNNDYWGNEMYALDLPTQSIRRIVEPSPMTPQSNCQSALPDGTPTSRHTYDSLAYIEHVDHFYSVNGAIAPCGNADLATWTYDFTGGKWVSKPGDTPSAQAGYGSMAAYDPASRNVYLKDNYNFYAYSFETGKYKRLNAVAQPVGMYMSAAIDTKRRKFVMVGDGVYTIGLDDGEMKALVTGNTPALAAGLGSPGVAYDPVADRIVAWRGGREVWALNLDTAEWTQVATTTGPGNNSATLNGTFGRWGFVPEYRLFVLLNGIDQNAWVFRLSPASAALPAPAAAPDPSTVPDYSVTSAGPSSTESSGTSNSNSNSDNGDSSGTALSTTTTTLAPDAVRNLPPGQWLELPNTRIRSVLPAPKQVGDPRHIATGWSGGTVDTKRSRLLVWGGGNGNYWGNEMYALDLPSLSMKRIVEPSPLTGQTACATVALPDGTPSSHATWDGLAYLAHADSFYAVNGTRGTCGWGDSSTWRYDFGSGQWTQQSLPGSTDPYGTMAAYDPLTKQVFVKDGYHFWAYSAAGDGYRQLNPEWQRLEHTGSAAIDLKRRKFVMLGDGVRVIDLNTYQMTAMATTNTPDIVVGRKNPGVGYDPVADRIVAWGGGREVWTLDMDSGAWTQVATGAGPAFAAQPRGTFGRWGYIPEYKVFALVNDIDQNAWVFRLSPMDAPDPTPMLTMQPGQWLELPNTMIRSVLPATKQVGDPRSVVMGWSGGTVDTKRSRLLVWGGGNGNYWGNEMYALDLPSLSMKRIVEPGATAQTTCGDSVLPDGTPSSRATWGGLAYLAHLDTFYAVNGTRGFCGWGDGSTWLHEFGTGQWTQKVLKGSTDPFGTMAAYDPQTKQVFVKDGYHFYALAPEADRYTQLNTEWQRVEYGGSATIDLKRRKFVMLGNGVRVIDLNTYKMTTLATTNTPAAVASPWAPPGAAYDPVADRIVAWGGGREVWALDMDSGAWTQVATGAGPAFAAQPRGTFGRWGYVPEYKVFALVNDIDQNAWLFKLAR